MTSDDMTLSIEIKNLSCQRGERLLFENLSLSLKSGSLVQLRGANGSGKSSLLRILADLLRPASGDILLHSEDESFSTLAHHSHYLGHKNGLKSILSVRENLGFWHQFLETPALDCEAALQKVELDHVIDLPAGVLSAGQTRRVAFARLLTATRPIWLLDEPTAALDRASDALIGSLISDHVKSGGVVIAATHLPLQLDLTDDTIFTIDLGDFKPLRAFADEVFV